MANVKITDLAALTDPVAADILEIVDDVPGTPTSKKITWANLFKAPVMTGPALGTPASGVLTNCTGLPTAGLATQVFAAGIGIGGAAADTGGIAFPATAVPSADPNTMDDYEEGTWTPVVNGTSALTMNGAVTFGRYVKIGSLVNLTGRAVSSSLNGATGVLYISGAPFTNGAGYAAGLAGQGQGLAITAGYSMALYMESSNTLIGIMLWDVTTGTTSIQHDEWTDNGGTIFALSYNIF